MQCASAIGARVKTPLMLAAAVAVALGVQAASLVSTGTTDAFTVGCVNCGAFHYGKGRATAEEFKAEWTKLAKEWPQDVFFYEDVGKGAPGNIPADNIILSPGLSFADFRVLDGYMLDTDHFPLVAKVRFAAGKSANVTSAEEFRTRPPTSPRGNPSP